MSQKHPAPVLNDIFFLQNPRSRNFFNIADTSENSDSESVMVRIGIKCWNH
jgi:hypothetical protein